VVVFIFAKSGTPDIQGHRRINTVQKPDQFLNIHVGIIIQSYKPVKTENHIDIILYQKFFSTNDK